MTGIAKVPPGVGWTVESAGILVLPPHGDGRLLTDLEAVAWDFVSREEPAERSIRKLALIGGISPADAEARLRFWAREWAGSGWVELEDAAG